MIHRLAHVEVPIPDSAIVWQFASVIRGSQIGEKCVIGACAIVDGVAVGDGCKIGHAASLHPGAFLGDNVFVGPCAVICNDVWPSVEREGFDLAALLGGEKTVIVEDGASIGANAVVLPGVRLGAGCVVAAGAVVTRSVPARCLWMRDGTVRPLPARRKRMRFAA